MQSERTTRGFSCRVRYMRPNRKGSGQWLLVMSFSLRQRSSVLIREVQMRVGSRGPEMSHRRCTRRWRGRIRAWSQAATKSVGRSPSCSSLATQILVFVRRPSDSELGQVEEIGPAVGRLDIEEGPLPIFARLDDVGTLVLRLAGSYQTAAGVGHVEDVGRLAAFYSRRSCDPRLSVVSSEVEKPLPQRY